MSDSKLLGIRKKIVARKAQIAVDSSARTGIGFGISAIWLEKIVIVQDTILLTPKYVPTNSAGKTFDPEA